MQPTIHASCVLLGRSGVLLRGPSGAGKSALAGRLIATARAEGGFGCLVADDRVAIEAVNGRLIARAPAVLAGRMELRGHGIVAVDHEPAAVVRLVADLVAPAELERMPEPSDLVTEVSGLRLPRVAVGGAGWPAVAAIRQRLSAIAAGAAGPVPVDLT